MKIKLKKLFGIVALSSLFLCRVSALSINDPGVVGTMKSIATDGGTAAQETAFAQEILDLATGATNVHFTDSATNKDHVYNASNTNYSGTIVGPGVTGAGEHAYKVEAGWDYVLAKYDGPNGGYVLYFINGLATDLPQYSYPIWGRTAGQYQISGFRAFNKTVQVPDGVSTAVLVGLGLVGLSFIARRRKSV